MRALRGAIDNSAKRSLGTGMATTSDSAITGEAQAATENAAFLPRLVSKILRRRSELGEGQWLSEELRIALEEMASLL